MCGSLNLNRRISDKFDNVKRYNITRKEFEDMGRYACVLIDGTKFYYNTDNIELDEEIIKKIGKYTAFDSTFLVFKDNDGEVKLI